MRALIRIFLTVLLAGPILLAVVVFWALQGGRDASPKPERSHSISDERDSTELGRAALAAAAPAAQEGRGEA
jgi:hypothetical protein